MHAARPNPQTQKLDNPPSTRGVRDLDVFPDRQATIAEVRDWLKTGKLPERIHRETT